MSLALLRCACWLLQFKRWRSSTLVVCAFLENYWRQELFPGSTPHNNATNGEWWEGRWIRRAFNSLSLRERKPREPEVPTLLQGGGDQLAAGGNCLGSSAQGLVDTKICG